MCKGFFLKLGKMSDGGVRMFNSERRFYLKAAAAATLSLNWPTLAFSQTPFLQLTDLAGRSVVLTRKPQRFVVANYIANFLLSAAPKRLIKLSESRLTDGKARVTPNMFA